MATVGIDLICHLTRVLKKVRILADLTVPDRFLASRGLDDSGEDPP
jgi:hypothetical protein